MNGNVLIGLSTWKKKKKKKKKKKTDMQALIKMMHGRCMLIRLYHFSHGQVMAINEIPK